MQRLSELNPGLLEDIRQDTDLMEEVDTAINGRRPYSALESAGLETAELRRAFDAFTESGAVSDEMDNAATAEAIILRVGRPSFLIRNDTYEIPSDQRVWADRLRPTRGQLETAINSVGRVELEGHETFPWVVTAWLVAPDMIVTNRHVAQEFASPAGREFVFRPGIDGQPIRVSIDFREEFRVAAEAAVAIERVLYIAPQGAGQPDIAVLKLRSPVGRTPVPMATGSVPAGDFVAVVGYPARDDRRNDPAAARDIFRDIYEKKRLAPGKLLKVGPADAIVLRHDCSTLGGNSGSVVLDVGTGMAIGLHFGGRFESSNYAVRVEVIRRILAGLSRTSATRSGVTESQTSASDYADRPGYQPDFLGDSDDCFIPLPSLVGRRARDLQRQTAGPHRGSTELKYMHFSIAMSKSRRMPYFTAANIDGESLQRPRRRKDVWQFDPRIPQTAQLGNSLYAGNNLDRGHQVRRLDPVWGETEEALLAQQDTFHYTNSCPQHARLNQGKTQWAGLEDYILDNTDERNLKVSVFTGPVLNDSGVSYRGTLIPEEYWKVVASVRDDGTLSATGYLLSQGQFLGDIEFAFGPYRTFQVPLRRIEELTGLSFGTLFEADPIGHTEGFDSAIEIDSFDRIVL